MKFISTAFLFFYCAVNWMVGVVVAFTPSFALSSKKQPANGGFYGKLSGIMRSGGLSSLFKRHTTLDMVSQTCRRKFLNDHLNSSSRFLTPFIIILITYNKQFRWLAIVLRRVQVFPGEVLLMLCSHSPRAAWRLHQHRNNNNPTLRWFNLIVASLYLTLSCSNLQNWTDRRRLRLRTQR